MSSARVKGPLPELKILAAVGAVVADVKGRRAVVLASAWDPITTDPALPPYTLTAREVQTSILDIEAEGTPEADAVTQRIIDSMEWEPWPD